MKSKLVMFLAVLLVVGAVAQAADSVAVVLYNTTRDVAVPPGGNIFVNDSGDTPQDYEFRISIENDSALGGVSMGFVLSSPDGATVSFVDAGGFMSWYGTDSTYARFLVGVPGSRWMAGGGPDGSCWDAGGTIVTVPEADADSFLFGGARIFSNGLLPGSMQHMLSAHYSFGGVTQGDAPKVISIDTSKYGPAGDCVFTQPSGKTSSPKFNGKSTYSLSYYPLDADDVNPGMSYAFTLDQNRPNPFNPSTTVNYSLARKSQVNISIFNILGQKVVTLVNGEQEPGPHEAVWEGRDSNGHTVASGIYFYKMVAGDYVQTRKMALMR
jgi:hypothetical protein